MRKAFSLPLGILIFITFFLTFPTFLFAADGNLLPDTGQTKCYNNNAVIPCPEQGHPYYGQDAQYLGAPPSYTEQDVNGEAIIIDNNTQLIWQQNTADLNQDGQISSSTYPVGDRRPKANVIDYCKNLNFAGLSGWRAPEIMELQSIVDYSRQSYPYIHPIFDCENDQYWSNTIRDGNTNYTWTINFRYGYTARAYYSYNEYVRCVIGEQTPIDEYINNGDKTVTSQSTGLTWQQESVDINSDGSITPGLYPAGDETVWYDALGRCEDLTFAGYSDWRLPNMRELNSLVDTSTNNPAIHYIFQSELDYYWSSTTYEASPNYAWSVGFSVGINDRITKTRAHFIRCVRGGLPEFQLDINFSGEGNGTVNMTPPNDNCVSDCNEIYDSGTKVTLIAKADAGYVFRGWTGDCSGRGPCEITMDESKSVAAAFTLYQSFPWNLFYPAILEGKEVAPKK